MRCKLILICLLLGICSLYSETPKTVTLVYEVQANPPYYMDIETINWEKPGISIEVLMLVGRRLNIEFQFNRMPWARGLVEVESNRIDGIFHASFKEERLEIGVYPMKDGNPDVERRLMSNGYFLYKRRDSPLVWDGTSFIGLDGPIGVIREYAIGGDLREMGIELIEVNSQFDNLRILAKERIAGVVGLESMNDYILKTHKDEFSQIVKVEPPVRLKAYYLLLSHKFVDENRELSESIWDAIQEIRETGEYDRIAQKYY